MKKARIIIIAVLAVLLLLFVLGWLFWSLGSIKQAEAPVLRLVVEQGTVFVKSAGGLEEQAKSGMFLKEGDTVRTERNSAASLTIAGRSDLRLSPETQVTIDQAIIGEAREFKFGFSLFSGRAWSRVMKLLDYNNVYESQADNVVATVRGTAFGLERSGNDVLLFVDSAAVGAGNKDQAGLEVYTKEQWALFDVGGGLLNKGDIYSTSTALDWEWVEAQRTADTRFNDSAKKYLLETLKAGGGVAPDDWKSSLARMSESWHLRVSRDECADLNAGYFGRRLYYVYDLVSRGKSGLAYQYLSELQKQAHENFGNDKCAEKSLYANQAGAMLLALADVNPENEMYKLKLRIEEMYVSFFDEHSPEAFWAHSLALDSRLDELERFDCKNDLRGTMQQSLDAVTQGILRQDRDFELLPGDLDLEVRKILAQKTFAQNLRVNNFLARLEACKARPLQALEDETTATSTTSTEMESATSTNDDLTNQIGTENQEPNGNGTNETGTVLQRDPDQSGQNANLNLTRIQLFAQPNPVNKGGTSVLYVKGIKQDGSEFDATRYAIFEQIGNLGTISGGVFTANTAGSARIIARVSDNGREYSSEVILNIVEPLILSRLVAGVLDGNRVYPGGTKAVTATAFYTNGQNRDVAQFASFSVSDRQMGTMNGNIFTAGANALGSVVITVQYTEDGIVKDSQITLQIGRD